jgi:hypothetical protein
MNLDEKQFGAPWWQKMLTRREANKNIAKAGALALLLSSAGIISGCDSDDDDIEVDKDTFELQKEQGWNIGATDKNLQFIGKSTNDSQGSMDWMVYLDPKRLLEAYKPTNEALQPFVVPTLVQALSQNSLKSQIAPVFTNEMKEAYSRGLGMREILLKSKDAAGMSIVSDLKGPEGVAFAAAMADVANPVITFDNWPHPLGVVPSHMTLGAMLFYAKEVEQKAKVRKENASSIFILDANRLNPYTDADTQFDNRYIAKLPPADKMTALKINNILYSVPNENKQVESDDINDDFATYKDKGISVSMLPVSNFQPSTDPKEQQTTAPNTGAYASNTTVYHYGGGGSMLPYFFMYYAFMRPSYGYGYMSNRLPPTSLPRPNYTPSRRPTMFSSSTVGGARGVGKMKPSGFGRVSTRMSSDGRSVTGIRSGRSGSFGRSRSGRFGG